MKNELLATLLCLSVAFHSSAEEKSEVIHGNLEPPNDYSGTLDETFVWTSYKKEPIGSADVAASGDFTLTQKKVPKFDMAIIPPPQFRLIPLRDIEEHQLGEPIPLEYLKKKDKYTGLPLTGKALLGELRLVKRLIGEARATIGQGQTPHARRARNALNRYQYETVYRQDISLLVPAFFHPKVKADEWERLIRWTKKVRGSLRVIVILNIDSGSGKYDSRTGKPRAVDNAYINAAKRLQREGIPWIGYVSANNGIPKRSATGQLMPGTVGEDVDFWIDNFPTMSGVFLTGVAQKISQEQLTQFCSHVRARYQKSGRPAPLLVAGPGTDASHINWSASGMFDWVGIYENPYRPNGIRRPFWHESTYQRRFGAFVYGVSSPEHVDMVVDDAIQQRAGFIYLSDASTNKWQELPSEALLQKLFQRLSTWNTEAGLWNKLE